jgi:hypothetical protein
LTGDPELKTPFFILLFPNSALDLRSDWEVRMTPSTLLFSC